MSTPPTVSFFAAGTPRPKARPRHVAGRVVSTVKPAERVWRAAVERACRGAIESLGLPLPLYPAGVPFEARMLFTFRTADRDRIGTWHTQKPDKDNLEKLVLDVMVRCGLIADDSGANRGPVEKVWGHRPGVAVILAPLGALERESVSWGGMVAPDWL